MEITMYEELSMNAFPAIKTQLHDGWILRFANGYTNRANSVNPLYHETLPVEEKLGFCEDIYSSEGLPTVYKITPRSAGVLDGILDTRGYEKVTPTNIMIKKLPTHALSESGAVITDKINTKWQDSYFRLNGVKDDFIIKTGKAIQDRIINKTICASIEERDVIAACGLCVVERGYAGLFDITVGSDFRRRGLGFDICSSLLAEASRSGAKFAYLQVVVSNEPAVALYRKLGFEFYYQYWYRVKKG